MAEYQQLSSDFKDRLLEILAQITAFQNLGTRNRLLRGLPSNQYKSYYVMMLGRRICTISLKRPKDGKIDIWTMGFRRYRPKMRYHLSKALNLVVSWRHF